MDTSVKKIKDSNVRNGVPYTLFGDTLISHNKLKSQDVGRILKFQVEKNILFGEAARQLGLISEVDLNKELAAHFNYPYVELEEQPKVNDLIIQQNKHGETHVDYGLSEKLISILDASSQELEVYRTLRSHLLIRWFEHGKKSLVIASSNLTDEASLFVANLAITFAQLNKKVLLVDANLRVSQQHQLFGISSPLGLADILENIISNNKGSYELAQPQSLPNLSILTAGQKKANPQELLSTIAFAELLSSLESAYDVILIDSAPLALGSDVLSVTSKVSGVIILATKDSTPVNQLQSLHEQLKISGVEIVGCIYQEL